MTLAQKRAQWSFISFRMYLVWLPCPSMMVCNLLGKESMKFNRYFSTQSSLISHTKRFQNVIFRMVCCYLFKGSLVLHLLTKSHQIS
jgi:hypothetical protein